MNVQQILLGITIVIIIYLVYAYFFHDNTSKKLVSIRSAKELEVIKADELPGGVTNDYTYSVWVYVNDWNHKYGEKKVIFGRLDTKGNASPSVVLHETLNNVEITINVYNPDSSDPNDNGDRAIPHTCTLENLPLQRWTNILITLNNRALDVYLDGKLVRTCILPGVPKTNPEADVNITPDNGYSGMISNFRYISRAINPREAYNIYKEGFGGASFLGGLMDKYGVKFSLMVDNEEKYKIKI